MSVKENVPQPYTILEGQCAGAEVCPLSRVEAGTTVCIKGLRASPEVIHRLRELGLFEEQHMRLVSRQASYICQVCNARLGLSEKLADSILVQTVAEV